MVALSYHARGYRLLYRAGAHGGAGPEPKRPRLGAAGVSALYTAPFKMYGLSIAISRASTQGSWREWHCNQQRTLLCCSAYDQNEMKYFVKCAVVCAQCGFTAHFGLLAGASGVPYHAIAQVADRRPQASERQSQERAMDYGYEPLPALPLPDTSVRALNII